MLKQAKVSLKYIRREHYDFFKSLYNTRDNNIVDMDLSDLVNNRNGRQAMSNYLRPSEIAKQKLITNSKGNGDYRYVLRLIESGRLKAKDRVLSGDKPYYVVHKDEIERYREEWEL